MDANKQHQFVRYQSRYQQRVFSFVLSLVHDWNDAEEILQEASVVMWEKFERFEPGTNYLHWANTIALYEVRKFRSRKNRDRLLLSDGLIDQLADEASTMEERLDGQTAALGDCLAKLSDKDNRLVLMRYQPGISTGAIAAELGRSVESVCNSLRRIRTALLHCVQREYLNVEN